MVVKMFSVFDVKTCFYHPPHFCHTTGHALRMYTREFRKEGSVIHDFPEDYRIFELGTFDDLTGKVEPLPQPHFIATVTELFEEVRRKEVDS